MKIDFRVTYKYSCEPLEVNLIRQRVYILLYNGTLLRVDLRVLDEKKKV